MVDESNFNVRAIIKTMRTKWKKNKICEGYTHIFFYLLILYIYQA